MTMPGIKAKRKQLVRKTLMRAKAQGERTAEQRQESPEEYAQTEVQQGISDVAARTGNTAKSTTRISYRKFRAMQEKRKNLTLQGSAQSASKPTEKEKVTVPTQTERREMFKKQRFRQKATAAKSPAPQAPVPPSATPAPSPYQAQMQQHLKRQHLTREAVRRYLQKQTATTAAGNTAPIVTHAPKLPTISSKQATVEAISRGVHYIAAKIKALLSQTVRRAAQSLLALLGAGCVVLVLAMVIGAAAAVIGSPMGILFADESGDPNSIPIAEIVADTNADFGAAINDIVSAHPECSETTITYDYEDGHTFTVKPKGKKSSVCMAFSRIIFTQANSWILSGLKNWGICCCISTQQKTPSRRTKSLLLRMNCVLNYSTKLQRMFFKKLRENTFILMQMMTRLQRFADVGSLTSTCFLSIGVHAEHFTQQNK